jgi:2-polyprenyl-3-methyl-5-hydroxy-6-metoxy-1,4-benzoquinol methylase
MERIPEPELMNDTEQARAYAQADFNDPHSMFIDLFRQRFSNEKIDGRVIDLGCGPADISIRFARTFPECRIDAVDGAEQMLKQAENALRKEHLQGRVSLIKTTLQELKLPRDDYAIIISNSLLHHLHDPDVFWNCIKNLAGESIVFIMDLMRPQTMQDVEGLVEVYAAEEPEILRRDFHHSLCAAFRPEEIKAQLTDARLETLEVEIVSDRHLNIYGRY